jgi:predicted methyltransferase
MVVGLSILQTHPIEHYSIAPVLEAMVQRVDPEEMEDVALEVQAAMQATAAEEVKADKKMVMAAMVAMEEIAAMVDPVAMHMVAKAEPVDAAETQGQFVYLYPQTYTE